MRIEAETIQAINPNDIEGLFTGYGLILAGDAEYGLQLAQKGLALAGPAAPPFFWGALGDYYFRRQEYAASFENFRKAYRDHWIDHVRLIVLQWHLGRIDEARAEVPILLKLHPQLSVREYDRFMKALCLEHEFRERVLAPLRLVGIPEEPSANRAPQADAAAPNSQR